MKILVTLIVSFSLFLVPAVAAELTRLPGWSEQIEIRDSWLEKRHGLLLPMMRRHDVDMWIVVNEEFHDDPLTEFVAPARPYAGNRDIFVFIDAGDAGLKKHAVTGYAEESVARFFQTPDEPAPAVEGLATLDSIYEPKKIAIGIGGTRGVTRSLTHDSYELLVKAFDGSERFVPAADLIEEYLDTRIPEEREIYVEMVKLTEALARRALSSEVIRPGSTTVGDIQKFLFDAAWNHRVDLWFQPDIRVQRRGATAGTSRGFLAVAPHDMTIMPGDLLHLDFGIRFMGLNTDWQKMAYVLREGESEPPIGLRRGLTRTNALQDSLIRHSRPGMTAAEVYEAVMAEMTSRGINAQIYSHPLGNQGHALGASIDFRAAQRNDMNPSRRLRNGSWIAVELNTRSEIPEWDGQEVFFMQEDPAWLDEKGWHFFVPRQEELYVIGPGRMASEH